jgi:ribosomal protein S18 acetylase RimI-like enzyme
VSIAVRAAGVEDLNDLSEVYRRSSLSNEGDLEILLRHPEVLELSGEAVREGRTWVAIDTEGVIVGFVSYLVVGGIFEIDDLFVDPPSMEQGIGRELVDTVVALARAQSFDRVEVTANPHAQAFYERAGFRVGHVVETKFYPAHRMYRRTD